MTTTTRRTAQDVPVARGRTRTGTLLVALFAVYLLLLVWVVLWKFEIPYVGSGTVREIKLVPFVAIGGYGASAPAEVAANLALFLPFGLYLGLLAPSWPWWRIAAAAAGASLVLEVAQYAWALGSSDVSDVLANTAGSLAGLGLLVLARRRLGARTEAVMVRICTVTTALALVVGAVVVASPLHYAPPGGGTDRPVPMESTGTMPGTDAPG